MQMALGITADILEGPQGRKDKKLGFGVRKIEVLEQLLLVN